MAFSSQARVAAKQIVRDFPQRHHGPFSLVRAPSRPVAVRVSNALISHQVRVEATRELP